MAVHQCVSPFTWDVFHTVYLLLGLITHNGSSMYVSSGKQAEWFAPGYSLIVYSPLNVPSPENNLGY